MAESFNWGLRSFGMWCCFTGWLVLDVSIQFSHFKRMVWTSWMAFRRLKMRQLCLTTRLTTYRMTRRHVTVKQKSQNSKLSEGTGEQQDKFRRVCVLGRGRNFSEHFSFVVSVLFYLGCLTISRLINLPTKVHNSNNGQSR